MESADSTSTAPEVLRYGGMALYPVSPARESSTSTAIDVLSHCYPVFNVYTYVEILVSLGYSVACRAIRSTQGAGSGDVGEPYRSRKLRVRCPSCRENNDGPATRNLLPRVRSHQAGHITGIRAIFASPSINVTLTCGVGQGGLIGDFDAWEMSGKLIRPAALLLGTGRDAATCC